MEFFLTVNYFPPCSSSPCTSTVLFLELSKGTKSVYKEDSSQYTPNLMHGEIPECVVNWLYAIYASPNSSSEDNN